MGKFYLMGCGHIEALAGHTFGLSYHPDADCSACQGMNPGNGYLDIQTALDWEEQRDED